MKIVNARGGYYVERTGKTWAKVVSGVLLAPWLLILLPAFAGPPGGYWAFVVFWTVVLFIPAAILSLGTGRTRRHRIVAVVHAHKVAGGVLLHVMDTRQVSHQIVTDETTAQGLAHVLTGRTGIERA